MTLDIPTFRALFTAYSDETNYPDEVLNQWYEIGKCYVKDNDCVLPDECRGQALMAMLAHLLYIQDQVKAGNQARVINSATEGKVSVSLAEPPYSSNFSYWLNCSPYGPQVLAMLEVAFAGGGWVGDGLPRPTLSGGY